MEADVGLLRAENAELKEEISVLTAQVEAATANADHAAQSMEQRYTSLAEQQGRLAAEKDKLASANENLQKELLATKQEINSFRAKLVEKDAALEKKGKEFDAERSMKVALDRAAERKDADMKELELKLKKTQEKVLQLTEENNMLEARAQEAQSKADGAARVEHDLKSKLTQQEEIGDALEGEAKSLRERYQKMRLELENRVMELGADLERVTRENEALKKDLERERRDNASVQEKLQERNKRIKALQDEAHERERDYSVQSRLKDDLNRTLQEQNRALESKRADLAGINKELRENLTANMNAANEAVRALEEERDHLKKQLAELDQQQRRLMEAAASGQLPVMQAGPVPAGLPIVPGDAANWSRTELYSRYIDAMAKARDDRCTIRQFEIIMQQVQSEVEKKAVLVKEQRLEHMRLMESHSALSKTVESLTRERRDLQRMIAVLENEARRSGLEKSALEQQVKDISKQVVTLLNEVEVLRGGRPSAQSTLLLQAAPPAGQMVTASDVVSERLVTFTSVEELQETNAKQLRVIRELSEQAEADKEEIRRKYQADHEAELAKIREQIAQMNLQRAEQEELAEKVKRQRDLYRDLLQEAGGDFQKATALPAAAVAGIVRRSYDGSQPTSNGTAETGPNWQQLHAELEKEKEAALKDAAESLRKVNDDLRAQQQEAAHLRAEAEMNRSHADYNKREMDRYEDQWKTAYQELQSLHGEIIAARTAAAKSDQIAREERQKLDDMREEMSKLKEKRAVLESDLSLTRAQLEREQSKADQAIKEKFGMEASRKTDTERYKVLEERQKETIASLEGRIKQLAEDLEAAQAQCAEVARKAEEAAKARDEADRTATIRLPVLEAEVRELTEKLTAAQYRAASAEGKADMLQKAVQKAEERATMLEMQAKAQLAGTSGEPGEASSAEKAAEMELLQEEVLKHRDTVAALSGTVAQYKALAQSAEEAHKGTQIEHAKYKAEVEQRAAQDKAEIKKLEDELGALQKESQRKSQVISDLEGRLEALRQSAAFEKANLEAQLHVTTMDKENVIKQKDRLHKELRQQVGVSNNWQTKFESQQGALHSIIGEKAKLQQDVQQLRVVMGTREKELSDLKARLATLETAQKEQLVHMEGDLEAARHKLADAEKELELLHKQLKDFADEEKAKSEGPLSGNVEVAELVQHLRAEKEVLRGQLAVEKSERTTLEKKMLIKERELNEARKDLEVATKEERARVLQEEEFKANRELTVENSNLREANKSLREAKMAVESRVKNLEGTLAAKMEEMKAVRNRIPRLEADVQAAKEQAFKANRSADEWSERARDLMTKKIDLAEHEKALMEMKEVGQKLAETEKAKKEAEGRLAKAEASLAAEQKRSTEVRQKLNRANQVLFGINPERLSPQAFTAARDEKEKRLARLEESNKALEQTVGKLREELAAKDSAIKKLEAEVKAANEKVEQLKVAHENLNSTMGKLNAEKAKLATQVHSVIAQRTALEAELKAAREAGPSPAPAPVAKRQPIPPPRQAAASAGPEFGVTTSVTTPTTAQPAQKRLIPIPAAVSRAPVAPAPLLSDAPPTTALPSSAAAVVSQPATSGPPPAALPLSAAPIFGGQTTMLPVTGAPVSLPQPVTAGPLSSALPVSAGPAFPQAASTGPPTTAVPSGAPLVFTPPTSALPTTAPAPVPAPLVSAADAPPQSGAIPQDPQALRAVLLSSLQAKFPPLSPPRAPVPVQEPAVETVPAPKEEATEAKRQPEAIEDEPTAKRARLDSEQQGEGEQQHMEGEAAREAEQKAAEEAATGGEHELEDDEELEIYMNMEEEGEESEEDSDVDVGDNARLAEIAEEADMEITFDEEPVTGVEVSQVPAVAGHLEERGEGDHTAAPHSAYSLPTQLPPTAHEGLEPPFPVDTPILAPPTVIPPGEGAEYKAEAAVSEAPVSAAPLSEQAPTDAPLTTERDEAPLSPSHPGHSDDTGTHSDTGGKKRAPIQWQPGASALAPGGATTPAAPSTGRRAAVPVPAPGSAGRGTGTPGAPRGTRQTVRRSALPRARMSRGRGERSGTPPADGA